MDMNNYSRDYNHDDPNSAKDYRKSYDTELDKRVSTENIGNLEHEKTLKKGNCGENIMMTNLTTMQKWGNSLGLRIPKNITNQMGIEQGTELSMIIDNDGRLVIQKMKTKYKLEDLLAKCNDQNRPETIDFGRQGRELL